MKITFKLIYAFLLVLPIVVWLYNPLELYFLNDDAIYIPKNQNFFDTEHFASRVLTEFTLYIDAWLYGENAWGYHLTNLILHFICTGLVYVFVRKCSLFFVLTKPFELAALASFLFFIYAFHSEAVLWVIGRGGSLSTIFAILSLIIFLDRSKGKRYYILSLLFFAMGLLTYESIWIFPVLVSLLVFIGPKRDRVKAEWIYVMGFGAVFLVFLLLRKLVEGSFTDTPYGNKDVSVLSGLTRYAYNFTALFLRSFLPPSGTAFFLASGVLLVAGSTIGLWSLIKRGLLSRFRIFLYVSFLVCLMPYVMFGIDTHDTESERFLYFPSFFICLIVADLILLIRLKQWRVSVIVFLTLFHLFFLYQSSASFKQSSRMAKTTIETLKKTKTTVNKVYLVDVPTQYKGAFVFRIGFHYIFNWLAPEVKYDQLVLVSNREIMRPVSAFSGFTISRDSIHLAQPAVREKIRALDYRFNDLVLLWTDESFLTIY